MLVPHTWCSISISIYKNVDRCLCLTWLRFAFYARPGLLNAWVLSREPMTSFSSTLMLRECFYRGLRTTRNTGAFNVKPRPKINSRLISNRIGYAPVMVVCHFRTIWLFPMGNVVELNLAVTSQYWWIDIFRQHKVKFVLNYRYL